MEPQINTLPFVSPRAWLSRVCPNPVAPKHLQVVIDWIYRFSYSKWQYVAGLLIT